MSQQQFAQSFGIPVRTLQQWEQGKSSPAPYVISMIKELLPSRLSQARTKQHEIPRRTRWKVCINQPFKNCERIYPIQQRKVRELIDDISNDASVKRIIVFGSSVTDRCHIGSDVDLFVETSIDRDPISKTHDFAYDVWTNHTADERLTEEINRHGVVVYG